MEYGGYGDEEVEEMGRSFPPLLDLDVGRHLVPKMRFLKYTLGGVRGATDDPTTTVVDAIPLSELGRTVPPQFFGARLERTVAPRHAFLMHVGLPHGPALLTDGSTPLRELLIACRRTKTFCALCNRWRRDIEGGNAPDTDRDTDGGVRGGPRTTGRITAERVEAFDALFQRGILSAARNDWPNNDGTDNRRTADITPGQMVRLLIHNGANPLETDVRGISLLHWAAGCGNGDALEALAAAAFPAAAARGGALREAAVRLEAERDGATVLHWAAAGANPKSFGCGGHPDVCRAVLSPSDDPYSDDGDISSSAATRELVNACTKDGNSVLMWAAWSGSLPVVRLLIDHHNAQTSVGNRNGCTVAHWAASGGDLGVCCYLAEVAGVEFVRVVNDAGNGPLDHAVAYGRVDVVRWLLELKGERERVGGGGDSNNGSCRAYDLALDFVKWEGGGGSGRRKKVFDLFPDGDGPGFDE